jgi:hypothetical protein
MNESLLTNLSFLRQNLPLPGSSTIYTGDLTYYGTGLGACGITSKDTDHIVAVSKLLFDTYKGSNPNSNPLCGKKIRAKRNKENVGERSVDLTVVDRCKCLRQHSETNWILTLIGVGCKATDLDLAPSAFDILADEALGRVTVQWAWLD